jgi:hypothetical protein
MLSLARMRIASSIPASDSWSVDSSGFPQTGSGPLAAGETASQHGQSAQGGNSRASRDALALLVSLSPFPEEGR